MLVVGGHGYVGSRLVNVATAQGETADVVSRTGDTRRGVPSIAWKDLPSRLRDLHGAVSVVWLLDGAKHAERERLSELLPHLPENSHVVMVSTCTVYGDQHGRDCDESTELHVVTPHAALKAECERILTGSGLSSIILRLGALYGIDERGIRVDRVEKWVTQAAADGVVTVPEPAHWRGWLHRDQAARVLFRAARHRASGVFNVASANLRFGDAASLAARMFDARVEADGRDDACNFRVDAAAARRAGLLDEVPGEDLASTIHAFATARYPSADA